MGGEEKGVDQIPLESASDSKSSDSTDFTSVTWEFDAKSPLLYFLVLIEYGGAMIYDSIRALSFQVQLFPQLRDHSQGI